MKISFPRHNPLTLHCYCMSKGKVPLIKKGGISMTNLKRCVTGVSPGLKRKEVRATMAKVTMYLVLVISLLSVTVLGLRTRVSNEQLSGLIKIDGSSTVFPITEAV